MIRDGFWSDPSITDWIASAGGAAGFTALAIELWRSRRRRVRPPDELLVRLRELWEWFQEVIVFDGHDADWYLDDERKRSEVMLGIVAGQLVDDALNDLVGEARLAWDECFRWGIRASAAKPRRAEQVSAAEKGMSATRRAIDRVNELIRQAS